MKAVDVSSSAGALVFTRRCGVERWGAFLPCSGKAKVREDDEALSVWSGSRTHWEHLWRSRARRFRPPPSRSAPLSAGSTSARLVPSPAASLSSQSSTARTAPSAPTIFKVHRAGLGRELLKPVGGQGPETAEAVPAPFNGFGRHAGTRSSESALRPPRARRRPAAVQARPASPGLVATDPGEQHF